MRIMLCGVFIVLVGCQHTQLRHNTVHQSQTLAEIYEQQVLDNLAKTVHDAHALPFFSYPKDGTSNISQEATITATPFRSFETVFGINGKRAGLEQWGLTPVSDPAKLQLMQCAYQRAVYGRPLSACSDCCLREKAFEGKLDQKIKVYDTANGLPLLNPETGDCYQVETVDSALVYRDSHNQTHVIDEAGFVTIPQYDCNGPCTVTCGWLCHGKRCDVPDDCCSLTGYYCGTYVWVPKCYREHLSRLTLKILDYAVNDAPVLVKRQKEVELNVDQFGQLTADKTKTVGKVTAIIAIDDPISSVLVVDNCARKRAEKEAAMIKSKLEDEGISESDAGPLAQKIIGLVPGDAIPKSTWSAFGGDNASAANKVQGGRVSNIITPATPSPYIIPKQRTFRPGDSFLNQYQIQRDLRAISSQP
jgi:hypothetical protein